MLGKAPSSSRIHARERLRLVLVHDRANMSPYFMNKLKDDLNRVITKYMVTEEERLEVFLDQSEREVELKASIPVKKNQKRLLDRGAENIVIL